MDLYLSRDRSIDKIPADYRSVGDAGLLAPPGVGVALVADDPHQTEPENQPVRKLHRYSYRHLKRRV